MTPGQAALARKNLDRRFSDIKNEALVVPPKGWIRAIRNALGMTTAQLAKRMGVSQSRVVAIQKAEATGNTSIKTLRAAAEAMNCTFVYAMVPKTRLTDILSDQVKNKVDRDLARYHHMMRLENQALDPSDLNAERERLVSEIMSGSLRRIWDEA